MTWQLAAFSILALALAGGFAWYERSKPDARVVALVGALAAFAALGRIAFAALPNVKPTTDIVLIAGYALGGAPGFVVGAVAGLTSNFFFGQGPWTPWQMAAWGLTGAIGAGLAVATGRRIGRWPLAIACAIVGFGFAMVQDIGDWVTYSDHSAAQLRVYIAKGIGFDFIHAGGCLVFALAFGPALAHSLRRFDQRIGVVWKSARGAAVPMLAAAVALGAVVHSGAAGAASTPSSYLLATQNRDGGFGSSRGASSSQLYSGWVALGLAAAGHNPQDVARGGHSLIGYIRSGVRSLSDLGSVERTILAVRAAGLKPSSFGGVNLVARLQRGFHSDGSIAEQTNLTAFAVLALRATGVAPPPATIPWLLRQADADGGFNFATAGGASDVDDTGAVLEAIAGVRGSGKARSRAVTFLRRKQNPDSGFPLESGGQSNAQSTAFAIQGLLAAGVDPPSLHRGSPLHFLATLTGADGHVHYSRTSDQTPIWVTGEALMALARRPLPLAPVPRLHRAHAATVGGAGAGQGGRSVGVRSTGRRSHARHRAAATTTAPAPLATAVARADWLPVGAGLLEALALAPIGLS